MKIAIVGTRNPGLTFQEWEGLMLSEVDVNKITEVVSGGAQGIDRFAMLFAAKHRIPYMEFLPKYNEYGKYATLRRNTQIVKEANMVVAFPSAESRGTLHTIKEAKRMGKTVKVIQI